MWKTVFITLDARVLKLTCQKTRYTYCHYKWHARHITSYILDQKKISCEEGSPPGYLVKKKIHRLIPCKRINLWGVRFISFLFGPKQLGWAAWEALVPISALLGYFRGFFWAQGGFWSVWRAQISYPIWVMVANEQVMLTLLLTQWWFCCWWK